MTGAPVVAVSGVQVMTWSLFAIASAMVVFVACTLIGRLVRFRGIARRTILRDSLRPFVVTILADPKDFPAIPTALHGRSQALFEVLALDYLTKVRGESRRALVSVLEARGTIDSAERRIGRPGGVGRAAAAELLGRCGLARSEAPLKRLLTNRSVDVRVVGVRALGRLGLRTSVPAVLATVDAPRPVPRAHVTQAVVRIGPAGVPALRALVGDVGAAERAVAVEALGLLRAVPAVPELIHALGDESGEVRERATGALGRIGDPRAVQPLLDCVPSGSSMDVVVAHALGDMGDAKAIPALRAMLGDERHEVAATAATSLTRCGPMGSTALREVVAGGDAEPAAQARAALARAALGREPLKDESAYGPFPVVTP